MDESRRKLEELLNPSPPIFPSHYPPVQPDSTTSFGTLQRTGHGVEMTHERSHSGTDQHQHHQHHPQQQQQQQNDLLGSSFTDGSHDHQHQPRHARRNPELHRREAQSTLYRKWRDDRARKIADLAAARDQHALRQAQHSMQRFQQTLAAMQQRGT